MIARGFVKEKLSEEELAELTNLARLARGDVLKMTTLAGSGHPGGALSSLDIYAVLYSCANIDPADPKKPDRDRIIVSHGHTSAGVYAVLGRVGFFNIDEAVALFRKAGSIFEGHVERQVPGVEWSTGNLGQGLSAGCGFALASKLLNKNYHVFVVMSDGEQTKGQVAEARRFAKKYKLNNLTVIIDYNELQISGSIHEVMPHNLKDDYIADGWSVLEIDGHNYEEIYQAIYQAINNKDNPVAIIAHTVMGKGISFMENNVEFHGKALTVDQYKQAIAELGLPDDLSKYKEIREKFSPQIQLKAQTQTQASCAERITCNVSIGSPRTYTAKDKIDNRSAFGNVMRELAELNYNNPEATPIAVFDCDLAVSVKTDAFAKLAPSWFFQCGVQEHTTATIAGALSICPNVIVFYGDFGVFGIDETYNQHRLNDINNTNLKLITTHNGIDVGEDGKTHHCIDYIGVMNNLYGFKIIVPADPNQTDRIIRYIVDKSGNYLICMGRSPAPIILKEDGTPFFGDGYEFVYGKADFIRSSAEAVATIISYGMLLSKAVQAYEILKEKGYQTNVLNISCITDIDLEAVKKAAEPGIIIVYEDHNMKTGLGAIIGNIIAEEKINIQFRKLGLTDYAKSGKPDELYKLQKLDVFSLVNTIIEEINKKV